MKNMKIGTKIILGFGMVIALVVVITVSVVISGASISGATNEVYIYNGINDVVTEVYDDFYSARIFATRFNIRYSTDVWDSFAAAFESTRAESRNGMSTIERTSILSSHSADWGKTMGILDEYYAAMLNVRNAYVAAEEAKDTLVETGPEIVAAVNTIYSSQVSGTRDQINRGDDAQELNTKMDRIQDSVDINNLVTIMRINVSRAIENYTAESVSDIKSSVAAVRDRTEVYLSILRTEGSRALAMNALEILQEYEDAIDAFIRAQETVAAEKSNAERLGAETLLNLEETSAAFADRLTDSIAAAESASSMAQYLALAIAGVAIIVSVVIAVFIKNAITKPVLFINDIAARIASEGELEFSAAETETQRRLSEGKDETSRTMANFGNLIDRLKAVEKCLSSIAANDLTVQFEPLGSKDNMGIALKSMLESLNSMFGEISSSSVQVSQGSKQVADGSQTLAQGATEQAASIQQLSSSIAEIAENTKTNASMATKASALAGTIKDSAEKGSRQMDEMMVAVSDINDASGKISKVIKVIDDIAFQTNILALNAAVEAARAGQHGKGFAVVAEEVRNLAAKSAEAAKDTGNLIENSIEKANLGVRIAGETAESLTEIVSGINESSRLVGDIATSSEAQSLAIGQINVGIDQVAQVVQQNSATAEESAAASQEMKGQSDMLQQLISQFKLAGSHSEWQRSLPQPRTEPVSARSIDSGADIAYSTANESFGKY